MTDVLTRAAPFLNVCGSCDAGLPMSCTCPTGDYRPVMLDLVREVEALRAELEPARATPGCPRCGDRLPLGEFGICVPCAALMGWDPECAACLIDQQGKPTEGLTHLRTCAAGRTEATR